MGSEAQHRPVPVVDADLDNLYYADEPEEPPLPRKRVPSGDVYEAARAGDIERLKILLEQGVNVNARDAWDSVALYYACLAGHLDAARMLLESGAICSEHTFDGDRCHYAALNLRVRKLLKAFEARPPPLEPLPKSLRELFLSSKANSRFLEGSTKSNLEEIGHGAPDGVIGRIQNGKMQANAFTHSVAVFNNDFTPDITFYVGGWPIEAHRAILVARSPFFKKKFEKEWKQRKEIRLSNRKLTYPALFSLVHFFYTDRLDVAVDDMEDLARICKVCGCRSLQKAIEKELVHQKYAEYKHMRDADDSQKRFILQGSSLPEEERLSSCLHGLLSLALARSKREISVKETDNDLEGVHGIRKAAKEDLGFDGKDAYLPNSWKAEVTEHSRQNSVGVAENSEEGAGWSKLVSGQNTEVMDLQSQVRNTDTLEASLDALSMSDKDVLEEDHADVYFAVEGKVYRSHQVILAARSEYFRTRFSRMNGFREGNPSAIETNSDALPILEEQDLSAEAFEKVLEYMYTDQIKQVEPEQAEEIFDAASRYLLFPLKRAVADALLPQLETSTPVELCHWLLLADMYGVWKLREHCLDAMAVNFEVFSATPEFRRMLCKLPPPSGDSSQRTSAPRAPGGEGKENQSNLLDDLREKWLEAEGEELDQRDESACQFDKRLELLVLAAENDEFEDNDSFLSKTYPDGARYITDE